MLGAKLRAAVGARGGGSDFNPLDLSPLVFYDPADISTLWQDSAGTSQVTTAGQTVLRMDDISGNGYHASSGNGLTYDTDGYLEASTSSDHLYVDIPAQVYPFFIIAACGRDGSTGGSGTAFVSDPSGFTRTAGVYFSDSSTAMALVTTGGVSAVSNSDQKAILSLQARSGAQRLFCNKVGGSGLAESNQTNLIRLSISALLRSSPVYHSGENGGLLLFDYDIGDTNRKLCEEWMADRYEVTL